MKTLIDKAIESCGSVKELARRLDVKPNVISMLRKDRTISPDTAAMLAAVAGEDAREAAIQAMIENAVGTRREGVLREILGKGLALGVAGLLVFSYSGDSISKSVSEINRPENLTIYTSWNVIDGISTEPKNKAKHKRSRLLAWISSFLVKAFGFGHHGACGTAWGCTSRV